MGGCILLLAGLAVCVFNKRIAESTTETQEKYLLGGKSIPPIFSKFYRAMTIVTGLIITGAGVYTLVTAIQ